MKIGEERLYILFFFGMLFLSFVLNFLFLKFSKTLGIRNNNGDVVRWGSLSKPSFGGISFYLAFLISFIAFFFVFNVNDGHSERSLKGLFAACSLAFFMGLADDAYNTKPLLKFFIQVVCGIILIVSGSFIQVFEYRILNYLLTIFWVVALMNSINMLDNMDAITTVVSITIIAYVLSILFLNNGFSNPNSIVLTGVLASLAGFLFFNWHPSKLYMGDTGSQFLGVFLAAFGIIYFWNAPDSSGNLIISRQILIVVLAFIIPTIDTTVVIINRTLKGKSPFVGGKDHTTHHLFFNGVTEKRIAILYAIISLFSLLLVFYITHFVNEWNYALVLLFGSYFLFLFLTLFYITRRKG